MIVYFKINFLKRFLHGYEKELDLWNMPVPSNCLIAWISWKQNLWRIQMKEGIWMIQKIYLSIVAPAASHWSYWNSHEVGWYQIVYKKRNTQLIGWTFTNVHKFCIFRNTSYIFMCLMLKCYDRSEIALILIAWSRPDIWSLKLEVSPKVPIISKYLGLRFSKEKQKLGSNTL